MKIDSRAFAGTSPEFVLKTVFGYDEFRPRQLEIIEKILSRQDTLAIMPTGGGKSLCYQIPALIMTGVTVVVSPLISLMQDQVSSLEANGISSVFLNSTLDFEAYKAAAEQVKSGMAKLIYVSPEGLATERIRSLLSTSEVSCITIDEAHCISEWGHDFRPDYLEIRTVRRLFPDAVMVALTATATDKVRQDIVRNLGMKNPAIFISSFNRANIFLEVQPKRNGFEQVIQCVKNHKEESGIIYCSSRRQVDELAEKLSGLGLSVLSYHAGLSDEARARNQELFVKDRVQIIVATVAFGMGIDKPNVRFVINYDLPKSVEEYYQEIGRAGRDGLASTALLLYSPSDIRKIRYFFEDSANPENAEALLQGMIKFASSTVCRRKTLLAYFGEPYPAKGEAPDPDFCCDICSRGELPLSDVTIPVQKLLSCIIRTKERFGAGYVVDVLLGSRAKRIVENGHNMLSTWGIGNEFTRDGWLYLVELLVERGYLYKDGEYNILRITSEGHGLLVTREKVSLPVMQPLSGKGQGSLAQGSGGGLAFPKKGSKPDFIIHKKSAESRKAQKPSPDDSEAERIIAELKSWRRRKADDMNVPPYIIFDDKTLLDIASKKPRSRQALLEVYGLGKVKVENFGNSILGIVGEE